MHSHLRRKPTRPAHAIAFSAAMSPSMLPQPERTVLQTHIPATCTHVDMQHALNTLNLPDDGFQTAVYELSNFSNSTQGTTASSFTLMYSVLRRLAQVPPSHDDFVAVAEDALWLCFSSAAGSSSATVITHAQWLRFASAIGCAVGGVDSLPAPQAGLRCRAAWRFAQGVRRVLPLKAQKLDFARLLVALRFYDAGLIVVLRAVAVLLTDAVRNASAGALASRMPLAVPDADADALLLSQFLAVRLDAVAEAVKAGSGVTAAGGSGDMNALSSSVSASASEGALTHLSSGRLGAGGSGDFSLVDDASQDEERERHSSINGVAGYVRRSRKTSRGKTPFHIDFSALELKGKIGSGAYGEVYEGVYLMSPVAVKVFHINLKTPALSQELEQQPGELTRMSTVNALKRFATTNSQAKYHDFVREVKLMSLVRHPNLVLYMGACGDAFTPLCIVSQLFTGGSLHDYLHDEKEFKPTVGVAIAIALAIARGMHYLHSSEPSILHRDLKSRNVLLSGQKGADGVPHVVICDFGLCQLFGERGGGGEGKGFGTAAYMSPDAIVGERYVAADDVYSYGVLLHEIFTACVPMEGMRVMEIAFQVTHQGLRPTHARDDAIPDDVKLLIGDCWHAERKRRPAFDVIISRLDEICRDLASASA